MATPLHVPIDVDQLGSYFVQQYYKVLLQTPDHIHQFYSDASTMIRMDGNIKDTASATLQIHALVRAVKYSAMEIKTVQSLESLNGGVLVTVSGSAQLTDFRNRRKFVEIFFLAPQENGYFVLNDVFHYIDDDQLLYHPAVYVPPTAVQESADYSPSGEIQGREFMSTTDVKENYQLENYSFSEQQLQQVHDFKNILEEKPAEEVNGSFQLAATYAQENLPAAVDEPFGEPKTHTYASIVAKENPVAPIQPPVNRLPPSEPTINQANISSNGTEKSETDTVHDYLAVKEEDEIKSVYVKNISSTMTESDIEEEFEKFGKVKPGGVAIRTNQEYGIYFAFVEFEDITGFHNAVEAGRTFVAERPVYIEKRRVNRISDTMQDYSAVDEDETKSVYAKNISSTMTESDIEEEFKKFGKVKPGGVDIRSNQEYGTYFAFVEFEDMIGFHNAVEAGRKFIAGRPVYIEKRKVNTNIASRGRGRGRGSYHTDAPRGRGRNQNGQDGDYNRPRGNSYYILTNSIE